MHSKYKIFQKGYNKVLDLLEIADYSVFKKYIKFVSCLPNEVIERTQEFEEFDEENDKYIADLTMCVNKIDFDYINLEKYFRTSVMIHRFFEEDIIPKIDKKGKIIPIEPIEIFTMEARNTPNKKPTLEVYYEQDEKGFKYIGNNDGNEKPSIDFKWIITLEQVEDTYILRSVRTARGWEIYEKTVDITFDELMQCVEDEDEYEDDFEIEFDADFSID